MSRHKEFELAQKTIDPKALQIILQYDILDVLEELNEKISAFITFSGPMTQKFKTDFQYQHKLVPAGGNATVYTLKNSLPNHTVGIITQVANNWYPNTFLEWFIDSDPKRVEYIIGTFPNPKEYERGIPFHDEVKWIAYNNDTVGHNFGVLMDGFFISKAIYEKITHFSKESK